MRTYGRSNGQWVEITTDANGFNDGVYLTTLIQCLLLNRGESPFYNNYGIPAQQSVVQQVFPDFYTAQTQQQFAQYFAALTVSKVSSPTPTYNINVTTNQGATLSVQIPV